jgi:hypothetical protein
MNGSSKAAGGDLSILLIVFKKLLHFICHNLASAEVSLSLTSFSA